MISSSSISLSELLQLGRFTPAPVQREFQWTTEQIRQLLDDVFGAFQGTGADPGDTVTPDEPDNEEGAAEEEPASPAPDSDRISGTRSKRPARSAPMEYFLGGVILFKRPRIQGGYLIYDGLQRLTTVSLLIAKLRDTWRNGRSDTTDDKLASMLFDASKRQRVEVSTSGRTLADVINARTVQTRDLTEGDYRMRDAVKFFSAEFASWSDNRRAAFLGFLTDNVRLTVTEVDNTSLAYQMFVAANARGLSLALGDVLKGQVVEQVSKAGGNAELVRSTAQKWRSAQLSLRRGFDDFLHAVEVLKYRPRPEDRHTPGEMLIEMFEDDSATAESIERWVVSEFSHLADIFGWTRVHFGHRHASGVDLRFRQLSFLGWKEWQPFYLALGLAHNASPRAVWERQIAALQRACYIIELLDWSARTRRRRFLGAIEQLEQKLDPLAARVAGGRFGKLSFSRKLKGIASQNLRGPLDSDEKRGAIVRWIETLHWGASVPRTCTDDASVEHVLPFTAMGDWETSFSSAERERLTNRLGNLCMIPKPVNDRIGNSQWPAKEKEYKLLTEQFKGVELALDSARTGVAAGEPTTWSAATIETLTEQLATKAERALQLVPGQPSRSR